MYEWIDETWNPLAGECPHKCSYCSTHKLMRYPVIKQKYSGEPRIDTKALNKNFKKGKTIFVCGQNDLFAQGISDEIINTILDRCKQFDVEYLFQTKNPARILNFIDKMPKNFIICTTIETNRVYPDEIMGFAPTPEERAIAIRMLIMYRRKLDNKFKIYVTIEPLMDFDLNSFVYLINLCHPEQVNIGADSGNNNLPEPSKEKVLQLIDELQKFTTIHNKSNLKRLLK